MNLLKDYKYRIREQENLFYIEISSNIKDFPSIPDNWTTLWHRPHKSLDDAKETIREILSRYENTPPVKFYNYP